MQYLDINDFNKEYKSLRAQGTQAAWELEGVLEALYRKYRFCEKNIFEQLTVAIQQLIYAANDQALDEYSQRFTSLKKEV